jgi:VIT1/CCC1 family predicted Fe2+/Mn2+ transporter
MKRTTKDISIFIRNFTFGVEDSLVSTVGLLAGISAANIERSAIVVTGLVLIFVEAFSMAVGSLLSEQSVEEYQQHKEVPMTKPAAAAAVMFFSYVLSGLIPLAPYLAFTGRKAMYLSVISTLAALFLLGLISARFNKVRSFKDGIQTLIMGGIAIAVGIAVGRIAGYF